MKAHVARTTQNIAFCQFSYERCEAMNKRSDVCYLAFLVTMMELKAIFSAAVFASQRPSPAAKPIPHLFVTPKELLFLFLVIGMVIDQACGLKLLAKYRICFITAKLPFFLAIIFKSTKLWVVPTGAHPFARIFLGLGHILKRHIPYFIRRTLDCQLGGALYHS